MGTAGFQLIQIAVPLVFFLALGALGLALTAAAGRLRRGRRAEAAAAVAAVAALPAAELGSVEALVRASRMSVRMRRLGWLFAIAVTILALSVQEAGSGDTYLVFGCGYLAVIAMGEALMPKPEPDRVRSAVLDPRRVDDYVPRGLTWAMHVTGALGIALCVTTIVYDTVVHVAHVVCAPALGAPVESFDVPDSRTLPFAVALVVGYAAIWLATRAVLGQIARRARPSGHPTLISMDDELRRACAVRVAAAGLGATLLTMPIPLGWIERSATSPCANASQTADGVLRWLMLAAAVAGLAALLVAPGGTSRLRRAVMAARGAPAGPTAPEQDPDA